MTSKHPAYEAPKIHHAEWNMCRIFNPFSSLCIPGAWHPCTTAAWQNLSQCGTIFGLQEWGAPVSGGCGLEGCLHLVSGAELVKVKTSMKVCCEVVVQPGGFLKRGRVSTLKPFQLDTHNGNVFAVPNYDYYSCPSQSIPEFFHVWYPSPPPKCSALICFPFKRAQQKLLP